MSDLEAQMAEVKALFKQKYGEDLDSEVEEDVDEDGTRWVQTEGTGRPTSGGKFRTLSAAHHRRLKKQYLPKGKVPAPQMCELEAQMAEVKALFKQKFGEDLDADDDVDEDGMRWVKTVGTGVPSNSVAPQEKVALGGKFGTLSCTHHRMLERQYLPEGEVPPPNMSDLEAQLAEVKALFKQKFGEDLDADEDVDE